MNHLTTNEIIQIVDETIANGERTRLFVHLESCQRCRQELQLQRTLGLVTKEIPLSKPSKGFTAKIIKSISLEKKKTLAGRVIDNLGNIIGMVLVLSVVWFATKISPNPGAPAQESALSKVVGTYVEYYAKARDSFSKGYSSVVGEPRKEPSSKTEDVALLTLISFVILIGIDRFVIRRVIRIRM